MQVIRKEPFYKGVSRKLTSPVRPSETGLLYAPGLKVIADGFDSNPDHDCGEGINFCSTIAQALTWGPRVVEVFPIGKVIDTGLKLRAASVKVGKEVDLSGANLSGAHLSGANLSWANLYGADLSRADRSRYDAPIENWRLENGILLSATGDTGAP